MQVKLVCSVSADGTKLWSLTLGKQYTVLAIEADDFRLLDDTRRPYLFPADCFETVESAEPAHWVCETGEDGERYCSPREWSKPGFFEDYFDGVAATRSVFWQVYDRHYRADAKQEPV